MPATEMAAMAKAEAGGASPKKGFKMSYKL